LIKLFVIFDWGEFDNKNDWLFSSSEESFGSRDWWFVDVDKDNDADRRALSSIDDNWLSFDDNVPRRTY